MGCVLALTFSVKHTFVPCFFNRFTKIILISCFTVSAWFAIGRRNLSMVVEFFSFIIKSSCTYAYSCQLYESIVAYLNWIFLHRSIFCTKRHKVWYKQACHWATLRPHIWKTLDQKHWSISFVRLHQKLRTSKSFGKKQKSLGPWDSRDLQKALM